MESSWESEERDERGPRRRFYRLGPDGLAAARTLLIERRGAVRQRTGKGVPVRSPKPVTEFEPLRRAAQ